MRTLSSAALAGALALSAATVATTAADARDWHSHPYYSYSGGNPGAALAAGAFLGLALGALASPYYYAPYPYPYTYAYAYPPAPPLAYPVSVSNAHVRWCAAQYGAWYNTASDTWMDSTGVYHRCVAPY